MGPTPHPFSVSYFSNQKTVLTPGPQQLYCNRYILTPIPSTLNLSCPHPHPLFLDNLYIHSKLPERAFMVGGLDFKSSGVQRPNGSIPSFRRRFLGCLMNEEVPAILLNKTKKTRQHYNYQKPLYKVAQRLQTELWRDLLTRTPSEDCLDQMRSCFLGSSNVVRSFFLSLKRMTKRALTSPAKYPYG